MQNVIEIDELSERLRAVVRDVAARRVPYVLAENGRPEAAIIPYGEPSEASAAGDANGVATRTPDDALAELDAIRERNDTFGWFATDSTDFIRWSREGAYDDE